MLAGIGLSTYSSSVTRAKEAVLRENLFRMRDAIDQYNADKGTYPPDLASLVTEGYLRQIPKDPFTESADTWQIVMSEPDPANPNAAPGVYDVKSGAEGVDARRNAVRGLPVVKPSSRIQVLATLTAVCRLRPGLDWLFRPGVR